jgi:cytochrome c peroxidase
MHDGSFQTLEQVLEHYNSGVKVTATLDTLLNKNGVIGIPLSGNRTAKNNSVSENINR